MRIALGTLVGGFALAAIGAGVWADDKADVDKELKKFQGAWTFESVETGGKKLPNDAFKEMTLVFDGEKYSIKNGDKVVESAAMKLDPSKSPKAFDVTVTEGWKKGKVMLAIYEISDDTLKVCFVPDGNKRPTEFKTGAGPETLVIHKRVKE